MEADSCCGAPSSCSAGASGVECAVENDGSSTSEGSGNEKIGIAIF